MSRTYRNNPSFPNAGDKVRDGKTWHCQMCPRFHRYYFMTRPKRRANKRACIAILKGKDHENMAFPVSGCKPHVYAL